MYSEPGAHAVKAYRNQQCCPEDVIHLHRRHSDEGDLLPLLFNALRWLDRIAGLFNLRNHLGYDLIDQFTVFRGERAG
ncbi:hypothetical protein D3C76_1705850 [compost metagenome]